MQEINVYVKGVVYQNKGKGFALSAWRVEGMPAHYIEHENSSAYGAEWDAMRDAVETLGDDDRLLHVFSNQKAMIDKVNRIQYEFNQKKIKIPALTKYIATQCDYVWCPLKESPADLLRLRDMAMREVEKRGKARV